MVQINLNPFIKSASLRRSFLCCLTCSDRGPDATRSGGRRLCIPDVDPTSRRCVFVWCHSLWETALLTPFVSGTSAVRGAAVCFRLFCLIFYNLSLRLCLFLVCVANIVYVYICLSTWPAFVCVYIYVFLYDFACLYPWLLLSPVCVWLSMSISLVRTSRVLGRTIVYMF